MHVSKEFSVPSFEIDLINLMGIVVPSGITTVAKVNREIDNRNSAQFLYSVLSYPFICFNKLLSNYLETRI